MEHIRIAIADDHLLFTDGLVTILEKYKNITIVGIAIDGLALLELLNHKQADLVILDISMPRLNGLEAAAEIKKFHPLIHILVVTMNDSTDIIRSLIKAGVQGIVLKNTGKDELLFAISEIARGRGYFSQKITQQLASAFDKSAGDKWQLTKREREILQLIYEGLSTQEIATKLFISVYTVETHKKNLFVKSGLNKSSQLVKAALELGYLTRG